MIPANHGRSRAAGVTLIEVLVAITIIALFAAIAWQQLAPVGDQGRRAAARAQIESFMTALQRYNLDEARFPTSTGTPANRVSALRCSATVPTASRAGRAPPRTSLAGAEDGR